MTDVLPPPPSPPVDNTTPGQTPSVPDLELQLSAEDLSAMRELRNQALDRANTQLAAWQQLVNDAQAQVDVIDKLISAASTSGAAVRVRTGSAMPF